MGSTKDWGPVMDRLADACCCIAIDLPGHGQSTGLEEADAYTFSGAAAGVVQVIKETRVNSATLVGYSMGGRIALYVAMHYENACSKLVIESAGAGISEDSERKRRLAADRGRAKELAQGRFEDFLRTWYCQPIFQTVAEDSERLEVLIQQRLLNDPKELARAMSGLSLGVQPSLWHQLPELFIPVLLIAGDKDSKYKDIVQSMGELMPRGRVVIVSGAGHNVHQEQPVLVSDRIKEFVLEE
jgi:2-succinyl-6-hydroxy-2,4-cyclohexadiene-1-carboxylate synthase